MPKAAGLYYTVSPSALAGRPPLLLIHGAGGTQLHWPPVLRKSEAATVYALDLPGHGKSDLAGRHAVTDYAGAVLEWMDALGLPRAVLAGHSMGGAVSLMTALECGARVAGLVLVGTGARLRVDPALLEGTSDEARFPKAVAEIVKRSFGPAASPGLTGQAHRRMLEVRHTVLHGDLLACNQFDVFDRLGEIGCPALVVCGTADEMTPVKYSEFLAQRIAGAELALVESAGHMVMLERPADVARAVSDFMDRHWSVGSSQ